MISRAQPHTEQNDSDYTPWPQTLQDTYTKKGFWNGSVLGDILFKSAKAVPNKIAIIANKKHWTYQELHEKADQLASGFMANGIYNGSHVVVQMTNSGEFFEVLFKMSPTPNLAYELADLKIQIGDITTAALNITYGIANASQDMMKAYFETKPAYQVPLKAGFLYLKAISKFTENSETNHDASVLILEEALQIAPNFNLANIAKEAILSQKAAISKEE